MLTIEVPSRAAAAGTRRKWTAAYSHYISTVHKAVLHCDISICGLRNLISHVPTAVTAIFAFASTQTEWSILETAYVKLFVFALITLYTKKVSWQAIVTCYWFPVVIGSPSDPHERFRRESPLRTSHDEFHGNLKQNRTIWKRLYGSDIRWKRVVLHCPFSLSAEIF